MFWVTMALSPPVDCELRKAETLGLSIVLTPAPRMNVAGPRVLRRWGMAQPGTRLGDASGGGSRG